MDEAAEVARAEAGRNGWPWIEPVRSRELLREYEFWTNARTRGGNVAILVGIHDGDVRQATITPR